MRGSRGAIETTLNRKNYGGNIGMLRLLCIYYSIELVQLTERFYTVLCGMTCIPKTGGYTYDERTSVTIMSKQLTINEIHTAEAALVEKHLPHIRAGHHQLDPCFQTQERRGGCHWN